MVSPGGRSIVNKSGNTIEWSIAGVKMATITGASLTSSNIFIGLWDSFASLSDNTNLSFAVFDNVRVERLVTNVPPYLTSQPQAQSVEQGSSAAFKVSAGGTAPLSYQWRCNGTNLAGASSSALTLTNALAGNAGSYTVVVTNGVGSVTSSVATLTVSVPTPAQPGHFDGVSRLADGALQFNMSGTAGTNYILQWTSDWSSGPTCAPCRPPTAFSRWLILALRTSASGFTACARRSVASGIPA